MESVVTTSWEAITMTDWCEKHDLMSKHRVTRYDEGEEQ